MRVVDQQYLKELLHYNPEDGVFTKIKKVNRRTIIGEKAGTRVRGYVRIKIDGRQYQAGRIAYLYVTGKWPQGTIDHIDGDPSNNRFINLRDVQERINHQNIRKAFRTSTTGLLGASPSKGGQFRARIRYNGKILHLGEYKTPQEAHDVYLAAKRKLHEGCTI